MVSASNCEGADEADPLSGHKLCGYLQAVLSVSPPRSLPPFYPCSLFSDGPNNVGFRSEAGATLLPIQQRQGDSHRNPSSEADEIVGGAVNSLSSKRRRRSVVGLVNGSISVVHQLHALVSSRCLKVKARILGVSVRAEGTDARAVVLIDVYLPIDVWSGWQFPRQGALAASFFKHVSCNWGARSPLLARDENSEGHPCIDDESIWSCSECHVLGCMVHNSESGDSSKNLFDLHEIFKTLPTVGKEERLHSTRINPEDASPTRGIWDIADDVLTKVLITLGPKNLIRVAATCRHLRTLTASVMPCMKLKLFPHQEAAVDWMLKREHNSEALFHPLYMTFSTDDGFSLYMNAVSGEISTDMAPNINDFRGGMFCDEPGLGKTVTALSLILKTHGNLATPPHDVDVVWCIHDGDRRCGYYELGADKFTSANFMSTWRRYVSQDARRGRVSSRKSLLEFSPIGVSESPVESKGASMDPKSIDSEVRSVVNSGILSCKTVPRMPAARVLRCTRSLSRLKRNILETYEKDENRDDKINIGELNASNLEPVEGNGTLTICNNKHKKQRKNHTTPPDCNEVWVQCDACGKWRKLCQRIIPDANAAWFCSMNADLLHQSCADPEEPWNYRRKITYFPGFYTEGTPQGKVQNISFFTNVLKEHSTLLNSTTMKAIRWLANLSDNKLQEMETVGISRPTVLDAAKGAPGYHKIFQAFGLVRKVERGTSRWSYPSNLDNLAFDATALKVALTKPLDVLRLYLSGATLIIVPANLVDHWKTQIQRHVNSGQLRVYVWTDNKKPSAHNLAWDYDIVITTFSRLSAEWGLRKRSTLMQVHWLRIMLDEGHTLGSSVNLTNKFQMAVSLAATNRWILTGTPTPNTPTSQLGNLQPMLKFLHEEAYGQDQESWEVGILRPFEAQMEEGKSRLLFLLRRVMISARKADLRSIPPCIKKATYLHFNEEHARSYNELVVTVRRNILMADWNDPSHVESLLNPKQWKFRSNTIKNVRLSCCVAGHIKVTDAGQDIQETMDILVQQGLDQSSEEYVFIRYSLLHGCSCFRCKAWCRLPVITPCRHLLCLDCVALDSERCTYPGCGNPYVMQPPEKLTRPENPNPKWPVPKDLIELQPSYEQDDWDPDWQSTKSSKVAYLVERLKDLQESNRKLGHYEESPHDRGIVLYKQKSNSTTCGCQESEATPNALSCKIKPDKVIIFSQFLEHIHVIEQQLTIAGIKYVGMYSPMPSSNKTKSLLVFQHEPNCMVLLMDGSAALGLDLSFVTHVFLMEPIWDRSMEEQVISRAHRMGATRPIYVETLAMRGTIEEQMLKFLENANMGRRVLNQGIQEANNEGTRTHRTLHDFAENSYLSQLTFVHTNA